MKTSRTFSTISFNTIDFLNLKLGELIDKKVINFYAFIYHFPEEDELKIHAHLFIVPNGRVETDQIDKYLEEYDPRTPNKPFKCLPFNYSKWADWYLYCTHDKAYLKSKGQTRKFEYSEKDFHSSDSAYLHEQILTIDRTKFDRTNAIINLFREGKTPLELLESGTIPIMQFNAYEKIFNYVLEEKIKGVNNAEVVHPMEDNN